MLLWHICCNSTGSWATWLPVKRWCSALCFSNSPRSGEMTNVCSTTFSVVQQRDNCSMISTHSSCLYMSDKINGTLMSARGLGHFGFCMDLTIDRTCQLSNYQIICVIKKVISAFPEMFNYTHYLYTIFGPFVFFLTNGILTLKSKQSNESYTATVKFHTTRPKNSWQVSTEELQTTFQK